jgi:hypothetical protein
MVMQLCWRSHPRRMLHIQIDSSLLSSFESACGGDRSGGHEIIEKPVYCGAQRARYNR